MPIKKVDSAQDVLTAFLVRKDAIYFGIYSSNKKLVLNGFCLAEWTKVAKGKDSWNVTICMNKNVPAAVFSLRAMLLQLLALPTD